MFGLQRYCWQVISISLGVSLQECVQKIFADYDSATKVGKPATRRIRSTRLSSLIQIRPCAFP
eukprot:m.224596 g.224596  ORF g.224596 m.224596 type:complete len:63 (-) comp54200_c0_seq1:561-749(-)